MHYIRFHLTKTHMQSLNQFFLLDLFLFTLYIIDFFINLQMTTKWAFAFLITAIIIFCLRYSLNIPHQAQSTQYPSFRNSDFGDLSQRRHRKIILIFCVCDFTIATAGVFTYYRVCLSFSGHQAKFCWVFQVY